MKNRLKEFIFSIVAIALSCPVAAQNDLLAFPTAEGFGKYASGGRGGKVVAVTTLEDDSLGITEGSLRWALSQYPNEPLTVVFHTSGYIELVKELRANRSDLTLAGQTAPGEGICISRHKFNLSGCDNIIVRHLRFRIGGFDIAGNSLGTSNALAAKNNTNAIFDHCTIGWSGEENMNTASTHFLTVQWCIVHEGLYNGGNQKGARSYATQWGGSPATYHHNLLASNYSRSCRFNGARNDELIVYIEYINNVNYNWGNKGACYGGENCGTAVYSTHEVNMVNNYYKPGPVTPSDLYFLQPYGGATSNLTDRGPSQWHIDGNIMEDNTTLSENNWQGILGGKVEHSFESMRVDTFIVPVDRHPRYEYDWATYTLTDYQKAEDAFEAVLASAGAFPRDSVDRRIIREARTGEATFGNQDLGIKGIIDDPVEDADGFVPYFTDYENIVDEDGDGMDDYWELANNLDPADPEDRNFINADGYTALEVYINSLVNEEMNTDFAEPITGIKNQDSIKSLITIHPVVVNDYFIINSDKEISTLSIHSLTGIMVELINNPNSNHINVSGLQSGYYVVKVKTVDERNSSLKFFKK